MSADAALMADRGEAARWLSAGLCLQRVGAPRASDFAALASWLEAASAELPSLPPAGVIADLGHLLDGRSLECPPLPPCEERLRAAIRAYEDEVLGRLAGEPLLGPVCEAVAALAPSRRPEAVALAAAAVLERIAYASGTAVSPGMARLLSQRPPGEILDEGFAAVARSGAVLERLVVGYEGLARAALRSRRLLGESDLHTLEHFAVLGPLGQRVAFAQLGEAACELERALPRRIQPGARTSGSTTTLLDDESAYPIGGYAALSTSGSLENLVSSELVYMEAGGAEREAGIDLFDLRYVENELLYYARDEGLHLRRRRATCFVLDGALAEARWKDPGARWQRLVLALALVVAAVRKLHEWLGHEELDLSLVFLDGADGGAPLAAERDLAAILLGGRLGRGIARVVSAATLGAVAAQANEAAGRALAQVILVGGSPAAWEGLAIDPRVEVHALEVGATPRWRRNGLSASEAMEVEGSWAAWTETLGALLADLL